jgi:RNA polymerase sigma-70 factor, ECF subfamily
VPVSAPPRTSKIAIARTAIARGGVRMHDARSTIDHARHDAALMQQYARGDQRSFRELYHRHAPRLRALLRARGIVDADDIVQQTFLRLHRHRAAFRPELELRAWLFTIAINLVRDQARRRADMHAALDLDGVASDLPCPDARLDARRTLARLAASYHRLSPRLRESLEHTWADADPAALSTPLAGSTSRVRAHRARHALRQLLTTTRTTP